MANANKCSFLSLSLYAPMYPKLYLFMLTAGFIVNSHVSPSNCL